MQHARRMVRKGFTLVEILIVVVILGILAAIVIPQFTNASESAQFSSTVSQLQTIRSQIELYKNEHSNRWPTADGTSTGALDFNLLINETNLQGSTTIAAGETAYGPYLQKIPNNPFEDSSTVVATAAADAGWVWVDGRLTAVMSAAKATSLNADTTNDVSTY